MNETTTTTTTTSNEVRRGIRVAFKDSFGEGTLKGISYWNVRFADDASVQEVADALGKTDEGVPVWLEIINSAIATRMTNKVRNSVIKKTEDGVVDTAATTAAIQKIVANGGCANTSEDALLYDPGTREVSVGTALKRLVVALKEGRISKEDAHARFAALAAKAAMQD